MLDTPTALCKNRAGHSARVLEVSVYN